MRQCEFCVAENTYQQVVEIVGDAAGEHPQALEFLSLLDLGFQLLVHLLGALVRGGFGQAHHLAESSSKLEAIGWPLSRIRFGNYHRVENVRIDAEKRLIWITGISSDVGDIVPYSLPEMVLKVLAPNVLFIFALVSSVAAFLEYLIRRRQRPSQDAAHD